MGNKSSTPRKQSASEGKKNQEPESAPSKTEKRPDKKNNTNNNNNENEEKNSSKKKEKKEQHSKKEKKSKGNKKRFLIKVLTGDAGSDSNIQIRVTQFQGKHLARKNSHWVKLGHTLRDDWEEGQLDEFWVDEIPGIPADYHLQEPQGANNAEEHEIELWHVPDWKPFKSERDQKAPGWFLCWITIEDTKNNEKLCFPFYNFISDEQVTIPAFSAKLPQNEDDKRVLARRVEGLQQACSRFEWAETNSFGWPLGKDVPYEHNFSFEYKWDIEIMKKKGLGNALTSVLIDKFDEWDSFNDFESLYKLAEYPIPAIHKNWQKDEVFAMQRVQGPNCIFIRRFSDSMQPKSFKFDKKKLAEVCDADFDGLVAKGCIYFCDYWMLEKGFSAVSERGFGICAPVVLYREVDKKLMPIAIQLYQDTDTQIYYPSDGNAWLVAKIMAQCADISEHECYSHLAWTHLWMEGVCVSFYRTLSSYHPLHQLLAPHFKYLLAINHRGFSTLISEGGWVDKAMSLGVSGFGVLLKDAFEVFDFRQANPAWEFKSRDVMDLEHYPARDDGLLIYGIIEQFVTEIVNYYYPSKKEVEEDYELQQFVNLVAKTCQGRGLPASKRTTFDSAQVKDLEWEISEPKDVIFLVSTIAWTASGQHATVNMPQYDFYGFVPNYPGLMTLKVPKTDAPKLPSDISEKEIVNMLMDKKASLNQIAVTRLLSNNGVDTLGAARNYLFFEKETQAAQQRFWDALLKAEEQVKKANSNRPFAYGYLQPTKIPNSISI